MSRSSWYEKCRQCGFLGAWYEKDFVTREWWHDCPRCGYSESWIHKSYFSNGHLEWGVNEVRFSAGAYCLKKTGGGIEQSGGLSEADVEKVAARVRDDIASGKLSAESYVTRFGFDTRQMIAVVGHVPTTDETEAEKDENPVTP
jgi:hypothetical protein